MPRPTHEAQTEEGKALRKILYDQIMHLVKIEGVTNNALAALIGASNTTIWRLQKNHDMTVYNLVRLLDVMGYEIRINKKIGVPPMSQIPEIIEKISKFKQHKLDAKRKERNQPPGKHLPAKIRVKLRGKGKYHLIHSRRQIDKESGPKDNVFNDPTHGLSSSRPDNAGGD